LPLPEGPVISAEAPGSSVSENGATSGLPSGNRSSILSPTTLEFEVLQRIVEAIVPLVEQHFEIDQPKVEGDDERQQPARLPAFFRIPVRPGQSPQVFEKMV